MRRAYSMESGSDRGEIDKPPIDAGHVIGLLKNWKQLEPTAPGRDAIHTTPQGSIEKDILKAFNQTEMSREQKLSVMESLSDAAGLNEDERFLLSQNLTSTAKQNVEAEKGNPRTSSKPSNTRWGAVRSFFK